MTLTDDEDVGVSIPSDWCRGGKGDHGGREGEKRGERRHDENAGLLTAGVESLLEDELGDAETNGSGPGALPGSPKVTVRKRKR